jgi:hypothetical protein
MRHANTSANEVINRHEFNQLLFPDRETRFQISVIFYQVLIKSICHDDCFGVCM